MARTGDGESSVGEMGSAPATHSGQQTLRRNRWIAAIVAGGLTVTVLTIALTYWWKRRRREDPVPVTQTLPNNANQQSSGYTFTTSQEGQRIYTVHAARTLALKEGDTTILENVMVEFFGRANGRQDVLSSQRCEYNARSGDLLSPGKTQMVLNANSALSPAGHQSRQQVFIEGSQVYFKRGTSIVQTDQPLNYRMGSASGSAQGLTYALKDGSLELKRNISTTMALRNQPRLQPPVRLNASKTRYDKSTGEISLAGPVEVTQGARKAAAEQGRVSLNDQNRIKGALLDGSVRGSGPLQGGSMKFSASHLEGEFDPVSGQLTRTLAEGDFVAESWARLSASRLTAQRFEMAFTGRNPEPQNATATGNPHITIEPVSLAGKNNSPAQPNSANRKSLTAPEMHFAFRPGGRSVEQLETLGDSRLVVVPLEAKAGERVITGGQFLMAFDTKSRLESLKGRDHTRVLFEVPPLAPPDSLRQETTSDRLDGAFDPVTGALRTAQQSGHFQFHEGDRQASSEEGLYAASTELVTLTGHPLLWDATERIRAERIIYDVRAGTAEGFEKVQGTHFEPPDASGQNHPNSSPSGPTDPTNVLADHVVAVRREQFVHYAGNVRAWRGQDAVASPSLDIYRLQRRLRSGSKVMTSFLESSSQPSPPLAPASNPSPHEPRPVTIHADRLEYFDVGRKASYRGNVELVSDDTTLHADHMDVYLSQSRPPGSSQVERAVADGHVTVTQPGRRALSERADYDATQGKTVLTGGPPSVYDAKRKGFTTGQRLTFWNRDDRVLVDGENKSPTLSKHRVAQ